MSTSKKRVLVCGHDLKFWYQLQHLLEDTGFFEFREDLWHGHNSHNYEYSLQCLEWADIIVAEWMLGNAVFYSKHKKPHQKLVIRCHLQERDTWFPNEINYDSVDKVVFVGEHILEECVNKFNLPSHKTKVIPNIINCEKFTISKKEDSKFNLGIIGIVPKRKRLDLAVDVLEHLSHYDDRYTLHVKGPYPDNYDWLMARTQEREYYQNLFAKINSSYLRNRIVFDPPGNDVPYWLSYIGYILSPSDFESFHYAVAEGVCSGAFPVVWNWEGADKIYPTIPLVSDANEAAKLINDSHENPDYRIKIIDQAQEHILQNYDSTVVRDRWFELLNSSNNKFYSEKPNNKQNISRKKIAVYGDINLNLIDGSAIWLVSLVEVLAGLPGLEVYLFLKAPIQKENVIKPLLELRNVILISPAQAEGTLTPEKALKKIRDEDFKKSFDVVFLRGFPLCQKSLEFTELHNKLWIYLTDIPQQKSELDEKSLMFLKQIACKVKYWFCQTEAFERYLMEVVPEARGKIRILPPMLPQVPNDKKRNRTSKVNNKIVYAGKFAPFWATREMFAAFKMLRNEFSNLELHVFGDKIHNPPEDRYFNTEIKDLLSKTKGVVWHQGVQREKVLEALEEMTVGFAWRPPEFEENTLELSTKILEYAQAGLPIVLARNKVVEPLFGKDYPFYANSFNEMVNTLRLALYDKELRRLAINHINNVIDRFNYKKIRVRTFLPLLMQLSGGNHERY